MKNDDSVLINKINKGLEAMENCDVYSEEDANKIMDSWEYSSEINNEEFLEEDINQGLNDIKEGKVCTD